MGNVATSAQDYAGKVRRAITGEEEESKPYPIFAVAPEQVKPKPPAPRQNQPNNNQPNRQVRIVNRYQPGGVIPPPPAGLGGKRREPRLQEGVRQPRPPPRVNPPRKQDVPLPMKRKRAPPVAFPHANLNMAPHQLRPKKPKEKAEKRKGRLGEREEDVKPAKRRRTELKKTRDDKKAKRKLKKEVRKNKRGKKREEKKRPQNAFITFFVETYKREGGDKRALAKECGEKWRAMSQEEKDKYKK